ncbi:nucleic acid binding protein [Cowpea mild mottle virus]|uniref:RNA silencing suppressor n=1 Tax=Cowpea mild mottle virus TaxID=67761 RepID=E5KJF6_9VIRU|nr:nucleic acid binding protein [Cowpea mild mottle virus]ADQ54112.1 nucleic acid binding protein [Cowpea mild mottle virus]QZA75357.1 nucleic acid binding protein [Cowpea mild mottle virus]UZP17172.1 nucleic acid binding protein [Cowpea mild mottle virus]
MIGYKRIAILLHLCSLKMNKMLPLDLCILIALKAGPTSLYSGSSSYARRRRAKLIGRCHRCYRVSPGFYFTTRCDGLSCVPGISYKQWVESFIRFGHFTREE